MVALRIPLPKPFAEVVERTQRYELGEADWEAVRQAWTAALCQTDVALDAVDNAIDHQLNSTTDSDPAEYQVGVMWPLLWGSLLLWATLGEHAARVVGKPSGLWFARESGARYERILNQTRSFWVAFANLEIPTLKECVASAVGTVPEDITDDLLTPEFVAFVDRLYEDVRTVRISPLAHLRAMWNLWWSAVRHPLSETTIDLSTGRVLSRA